MISERGAEERAGTIIKEIRGLRPRLGILISKLTEHIGKAEGSTDKNLFIYSGSYWTKVAYRNAFIKCRLIIDQNFNFIETLGLLAVSRYVFELLVWLRLLASNEEYGLAFFAPLLDVKIRETKDQRDQTEAEIAFFDMLHREESSRLSEAIGLSRQDLDNSGNGDNERVAQILSAQKNISSEIDRRARRNFCLYADDAKTNGYGLQAYLMRQQVLPNIEARLDELRTDQEKFQTSCPHTARRFLHRKWNWKNEAAKVGMQTQYDFLYAYTSRLLHAEPVSFFTDQKNLELPEVCMLLDYIYVTMLDALDLGEKGLDNKGLDNSSPLKTLVSPEMTGEQE